MPAPANPILTPVLHHLPLRKLVSALLLPVALLSVAVLRPLPALADDTPPAMISVTGTGTVEVAPDIATLVIGVTTEGPTAAEALATNTAALGAVMARLSAAGVAPRDMQTSSLSINPQWTGYDSASVSGPAIAGYSAANLLMIRVRQLDGLGAVLDAAVSDGANTLNDLAFGVADPAPVLDAARREAVADARARAKLLATAAGVTLGRVLSIREGSEASDPGPLLRAEAAAAPVPVAGGELGLSASVTIFFEIVQ